jgi:hypothetical protein
MGAGVLERRCECLEDNLLRVGRAAGPAESDLVHSTEPAGYDRARIGVDQPGDNLEGRAHTENYGPALRRQRDSFLNPRGHRHRGGQPEPTRVREAIRGWIRAHRDPAPQRAPSPDFELPSTPDQK